MRSCVQMTTTKRERKEIAKSALVSSCKREQSIYVFVPKGGLMYVHEWLGGRERERERRNQTINLFIFGIKNGKIYRLTCVG